MRKCIQGFKRVDKIKGKTFEERLQAIVDSYNNRANDPEFVEEILNDVTSKIMDLMEDINKEKETFEQLGIDEEEKAFYDILVAVAEKYKFEFPESENIALAKEIRAAMREKEQYADWANSEQIRAKMTVDIILILKAHGYPPTPEEIYEKVYTDIIEQAENFKKYDD